MRLDPRISDLFFNFAPAVDASTPEELVEAAEFLLSLLEAFGTDLTAAELVEDYNDRV